MIASSAIKLSGYLAKQMASLSPTEIMQQIDRGHFDRLLDRYLTNPKALRAAVRGSLSKRSRSSLIMNFEKLSESSISNAAVNKLRSVLRGVGHDELKRLVCIDLNYCKSIETLFAWIRNNWRKILLSVAGSIAATVVYSSHIVWSAAILILFLLLRPHLDAACDCNPKGQSQKS